MNARMRNAWRHAHRGRLLPVLALLLLLGGVLAWLAWPTAPMAVKASATTPATDTSTVERGRYLATLGNCQVCHTVRGGVPYAGGRGIATPFGTIFSSNLTPSPAGLGAWSADDFWRALHHGQSRDGRWLYPAFPYNNTTHITRPDSDALYAYLRSLPPDASPVPAHQLDWPYSTQAALKVWRALYFEEGSATPAAERDSNLEVQRGAYLVRGLGHCSACHAPRNALGANSNMLDLAGGLIPVQNWYAPSLTNPAEAGVQDWTLDDIVALFQSGRAGHALVTGPMADVVQHSTQHWTAADLRSMALYLKQLPRTATPVANTATAPSARLKGTGEQLYDKRCAQCHGEQGEGRRGTDGHLAYPPLAGNRAVTMASPANLVQIVLNGGFAPATPGHPRPFGMPPFVLDLSDGDVATVLTYIRTQWGNQATPVSALDVQQLRGTSAR
ncbi:MAG: c-type cytochrome [Hylemonella sp.]|nr:c-type cytochrome [Hylemonella sp.]MDP1938210.1 c-type cytochrome [Hylemonella sp.]